MCILGISLIHIMILLEVSVDGEILLALAYCQHISSAIGSEIHDVILGEKRHYGCILHESLPYPRKDCNNFINKIITVLLTPINF